MLDKLSSLFRQNVTNREKKFYKNDTYIVVTLALDNESKLGQKLSEIKKKMQKINLEFFFRISKN
jgi:hypothetical protein